MSKDNKEYNSQMLEDLKDSTFEMITKALSGVEKVGKIVTTDTFWNNEAAQFTGWKFMSSIKRSRILLMLR